jgi:hypothetical protein
MSLLIIVGSAGQKRSDGGKEASHVPGPKSLLQVTATRLSKLGLRQEHLGIASLRLSFWQKSSILRDAPRDKLADPTAKVGKPVEFTALTVDSCHFIDRLLRTSAAPLLEETRHGAQI